MSKIMKNQSTVTAEKIHDQHGTHSTIHAKNDLIYLNYLLEDMKHTITRLQYPYDATRKFTVIEKILSDRLVKEAMDEVDKKSTRELSDIEVDEYIEKHARKRIKKLVKIALNEAIEHGYALDLVGDFKSAVDEISCDIYDNCEGGEDRSATEIIAITFGLIKSHDLIRADKISRIKPSK